MDPLREPINLTADTVEALCTSMTALQESILKFVEQDPDRNLEVIQTRDKSLLRIDLFAEDALLNSIETITQEHLHRPIRKLGEESLHLHADDQNSEGLVLTLADAIDGTDLLQRGFGNWCSAVILYTSEPRILGSFVAIPHRGTYFSVEWDPKVMVAEWDTSGRKQFQYTTVTGPDEKAKSLSGSALAYYGQKGNHLLSFVDRKIFVSRLKTDKSIRIYNLAGIPVIVKLIDAHEKSRIHAVFELKGQKMHDFLPGAYLAKKAGAWLYDLDSQSELSLENLVELVLDPTRRIRYVLACNSEVGSELVQYLNGSGI